MQPSRQLEIRFVEQPERFGLGDAVLRAWRVIGDEPVAVLLPDKLMLGGAELLASMLEHYDRQARSMVAIGPVPLSEIGAYGCVELSNPEPGREADESGPPPITSDSAHSPSMVA